MNGFYLPDALARHLSSILDADSIGESGMHVHRVLLHSGEIAYLKSAAPGQAAALRDEVARLRWLHGRVPVPQVLAYAEDKHGAHLLMSAIAGCSAIDPCFAERLPELVQALAQALHLWHRAPWQDCPFEMRLPVKLALAQQNCAAGRVSEEDFDDERYGRSAEDVLTELLASPAPPETPCLTHGDACLPNLLFDPQTLRLNGWIDVGGAGIADPVQDLALCARSLAYNWGEAWVQPFFAAYGRVPEASALAYYRLLDEFF